MKTVIRICAAAVALLALPALAQPGWRGERRHRFADPDTVAERRLAQEPPPPPEFRRFDGPRRYRLSPEERRQLRRDIQDAGVGLYRRPPPPPPPPPPY
jgi:hypothetical protein